MTYFSFNAWSELILRVVLAETLGADAEAPFHPDEAAWNTALAGFLKTRLGAAANPFEGGQVDDYVLGSVHDLAEFMEKTGGAGGGVVRIVGALSEAAALARERECGTCAGRNGGRVCRREDTAGNGQQIDAVGLCVAPIRAKFERWEQLIRRLYRAILNDGPEDEFDPGELPGIAVNLEFERSANGRPHGLSVPLAVSGGCNFEAAGEPRSTRVIVAVNVELFDWPSLAALPYLFVHEIFCHGFQSAGTLELRHSPGDDCLFADGWLDCMAFEVFRAGSAGELAALGMAAVSGEWAVSSLRYGGLLHEARYDGSVDRPAYRIGRRCETLLKDFLRATATMYFPKADAQWPMRKAQEFAMALNARRDADRVLFGRIVQDLCEILMAGLKRTASTEYLDGRALVLRRRSLWVAIRDFCLSYHLGGLAEALQALKDPAGSRR